MSLSAYASELLSLFTDIRVKKHFTFIESISDLQTLKIVFNVIR